MELQYINENVYDKVKDLEDINSLAEEYKTFLNSCRTERQCAEVGAKFLEKCGYLSHCIKHFPMRDNFSRVGFISVKNGMLINQFFPKALIFPRKDQSTPRINKQYRLYFSC